MTDMNHFSLIDKWAIASWNNERVCGLVPLKLTYYISQKSGRSCSSANFFGQALPVAKWSFCLSGGVNLLWSNTLQPTGRTERAAHLLTSNIPRTIIGNSSTLERIYMPCRCNAIGSVNWPLVPTSTEHYLSYIYYLKRFLFYRKPTCLRSFWMLVGYHAGVYSSA